MQVSSLRTSLLFDGLTSDQAERCASLFDEVSLRPGDSVSQPSAIPHAFFVVLDGEVEVLVRLRTATVLGPGGFWSDLDLGHGRPALSLATTTCRVARVLPWDYLKIRQEQPIIAARIDDTMRWRTVGAESR